MINTESHMNSLRSDNFVQTLENPREIYPKFARVHVRLLVLITFFQRSCSKAREADAATNQQFPTRPCVTSAALAPSTNK